MILSKESMNHLISNLLLVLAILPGPKTPPLTGRAFQSLDGPWMMLAGAGEMSWQGKIPDSAIGVAVPADWRNNKRDSVWYWREVTVPDRWKKMNVRLKISAPRDLEIWVNGKSAGSRRYPVSEMIDITKLMNLVDRNLIAIHLTGATVPDELTRRREGMELVASDEAHIDSVAIDKGTSGWITIHVIMSNASDKTGDALLMVEVNESDSPKHKVAVTQQTVVISPGRNKADILLRVAKKHTDTNYVVAVSLRQGKDLLDNVVETANWVR